MYKFYFSMVLSAFLLFSGCDEVKDAIEEVTFKVTVVNNTGDDLTVFWNIDNGGFLEAGTVTANGGSLVVQPLTINTDNEIEVRQDDGTVVASGSYNQPDDTDRSLIVD